MYESCLTPSPTHRSTNCMVMRRAQSSRMTCAVSVPYARVHLRVVENCDREPGFRLCHSLLVLLIGALCIAVGWPDPPPRAQKGDIAMQRRYYSSLQPDRPLENA